MLSATHTHTHYLLPVTKTDITDFIPAWLPTQFKQLQYVTQTPIFLPLISYRMDYTIQAHRYLEAFGTNIVFASDNRDTTGRNGKIRIKLE